MKILNGKELSEYIKERQTKQARSLKQGLEIQPKLAIIQALDTDVINTYVSLKQHYGEDIGVEVEVHNVDDSNIESTISALNQDSSVHGIIVQLPIPENLEQAVILNSVSHKKDVDGLGQGSDFVPATPNAILWLLSGYNVELKGKKILIIGKGPLVGAPLYKMLIDSGLNVEVADQSTGSDLEGLLAEARVIITATGHPNLITSAQIPEQSIVVDAGVAVAEGKKVGDLSDDVYQRDDLTITPKIGGVGPLTVCALFENVLTAARNSIS